MRTFLDASATAQTASQAMNAAFALALAPVPSVLRGVAIPTAVKAPTDAEKLAAIAKANRQAAKPAAKAKGAQNPCQCSQFIAENGDSTGPCDATTARTFAPGHDAKLKAMLTRAEVAGLKVAQGTVLRTGVETAELFGFAHLVAKGAADKLAKLAAKAQVANPAFSSK